MKYPWTKATLDVTQGSPPSREPVQCKLVPDLVPARYFQCPHYSICLREVSVANWECFTCKGCVWAPEDLQRESISASGLECLMYPDDPDEDEKPKKSE